jgi:hypothetical protein
LLVFMPHRLASKRLAARGHPARVAALLLFLAAPAAAQRELFQTPHLPGQNLGVWRLTHEPAIRHWANYHNVRKISPNGRYVCYTRYGGENPGNEVNATVHVYDLHSDREMLVGTGNHPRWAQRHNWLFFVSYERSERGRRTPEVVWLDLDTGARRIIATGPGPESLGETDHEDRWLYGALRMRGQNPEYTTIRINIDPSGGYIKLPQAIGSQLLPNPRHPLFFTRRDHPRDPFAPTRLWYDLDGGNRRIGVPTLQQCHMSWLGDGEYLLLGNGLVRGRRWDEPFPSNIHILSAVSVGDVSPCGASGRWACGDMMVADLRSGDGWRFIEPLSILCFPKEVGDASGPYDADPTGSPDGTKIAFVSNYDLKNGPVTQLAASLTATADRMIVGSTKGFPPSGRLNLGREVMGYRSITATTFEGLTRGLHGTAVVSGRSGRLVTSFDARCLTEEQLRGFRPNQTVRNTIKNDSSPLLQQRMTDVYIAVVRAPDRPVLRLSGSGLEIIPGENHRETRGYHVLRDGRRITGEPVAPGGRFSVDGAGEYRAVAVEWSGLESGPSEPVVVLGALAGVALAGTPADFAWTRQEWAERHRVRHVVHHHDGVIRREWYQAGQLVRSHDLNAEGKAVRRVEYNGGRPAVRDYYAGGA